MPYFISYIFNDDGKRKKHKIAGVSSYNMPAGLYHASIALTEHTPPEPPRIISKVGLFASGQVEMEDFIQPKEGRTFYHKTYPITQDEMQTIVQKINQDRQIGITKVPGIYMAPKVEAEANSERSADYLKYVARKRSLIDDHGERVEYDFIEEIPSIPGGPAYSFYRLNCKTYAMSLLASIGIHDRDLKDWIVDDPGTGLKKLDQFQFKNESFKNSENVVSTWESPMKVTPRLTQKQINTMSRDEWAEMKESIQFNNFKGYINDAVVGLQAAKDKMEGFDDIFFAYVQIELRLSMHEKNLSEYKVVLNDFVAHHPDLEMDDLGGMLDEKGVQDFEQYRRQNNLVATKIGQDLKRYVQKNVNHELESLRTELMEESMQAIQKLEGSIASAKYSAMNYIVDSLKSGLNAMLVKFSMNQTFKISEEYKRKNLLTQFKSQGASLKKSVLRSEYTDKPEKPNPRKA